MQRVWLTLMVLLPLQLMAQDLSGIWKGTLTQEAGGCYPVYFVELQVKFSGPLVSGRLYDYYDSSKFVKLGISGRYDSATQRMSFSENKVLKSHIPADCVPCIKSYELTFSKTGTEERLTGSWKGHILDRAKSCPPGALTLQRTYKSAFPADPKDDLGPEIIQQDSLVHIQQMLRLPSRDKELVKTVFVTVPQITIEL